MTAKQHSLIESNLGLVHACVRRYIGKGAEYEDMYQAGCIGLVKAAANFDEQRGFSFSTYAVPAILGEIRRIFRDGGSVKVSRQLKTLGIKLAQAQSELSSALGRPAHISELAEHTGLGIEEVSEAICASQRPISLTVTDDSGDTQLDIPDEDENNNLLEHISLRQELGKLPADEQTLIRLRYFRGLTQAQTAKLLGTTQVSVSRREKRILKKLRACA